MSGVSVIIPVKDGGSLLERALHAVRAQGDLELIVIDSGSRDGSQDVARAAGATLIEIEPGEFGHGRTRNLGAERARGDLICFLTQDAVPEPGWLDAYREAFALDERVGAAFGPHLPWPDTSPMIARELTEFFAGFAPDGRPALHRAGDLTFLSNVNACYSRACWEELRFPELEYAEDQAFGAAMLEAGWTKVFHPGAAVRHAHDYGPGEFMKRYFDEYRGLREASGHVEPLQARAAVREVRADLRWMRERGWDARRRARWAGRSAVHQGGRRAASALGSRAERLPGAVQRALSLERRGPARGGEAPAAGGGGAPATGPGGAPATGPGGAPAVTGRPVAAGPSRYQEILRLARDGAAPLEEPVPGMADRESLHVAVVIPPFQRGSGGHNTIFTLMSYLERAGHTCTVWMYDPHGIHHEAPGVLRRRIVEEFTPLRAPAFKGFGDWYGADVVMATGWETVYPALLLSHCRARVYLINDHEPDFFANSAEALWAARTYEQGLYGISASRWLRDLLARRYGQRGGWFALGVNHDLYRPRPVERRHDTVVFYAREYTPRRAVPLGALALEELHARRPGTRFVVFGMPEDPKLPVPYEQLGIVSPERLSWVYSEGTVGLCLSLTNYSLIPQEMMACGLPCVDLAGGSTEAEIGHDSGVEFAEPDPISIAAAIERLLEDHDRWERLSAAGAGQVRSASWDEAGRQVELELREALRERERGVGLRSGEEAAEREQL